MDQAIGALSKLTLSNPNDPVPAGPDVQSSFAPYDPLGGSLGAPPVGAPAEGGPSVTLKSLLQIGEQYPQGPGLIPPYFMYGPARQPLLPTPQPYRPGPQPPIRGEPHLPLTSFVGVMGEGILCEYMCMHMLYM